MKDLHTQHMNPTLFEQTSFPSLIINKEGRLLYWSEASRQLFGYEQNDFSTDVSIFQEDIFSALTHNNHEAILHQQNVCLSDVTCFTKNDQQLSVTLLTSPISYNNEDSILIFAIQKGDILSFTHSDHSLLQFKNTMTSHFMVTTISEEGLITQCNDLFLKASNWTPKRVIGKTFWQLFPKSSDNVEVAEEIWQTLQNGNVWQGEVEKITKDRLPYWTDLLAFPVEHDHSFMLVEKDITREKTLQLQLEKIAYIDTETGFINVHRLEQIIDEMIGDGRRFSFVYISIDMFYTLKGLSGFDASQSLAADFATRLKMYFQDSTIARINASDFVIITPLPEWFIQGFLTYLQQHPIYNDHSAVPLSISGSMTRYPEDQQTFAQLLKASTRTVANAREAGGNHIMTLSKENHMSLHRQSLIEKRLLLALDQNNLQVLYQPQKNVATGEITAVEALVRWQDEEVGVVTPDELIPIAEQTGLIHSIGSFVLQQAGKQALAWQKAGLNLKVSINVSVREFRDKNMTKMILTTLQEMNCPAHLIQIEITEKFALEAESESAIMKQMRQLEQAGITFVLDDFGTGYASFRFMQLLPLETLKIDSTFIQSITKSEKAERLVHGIIQLAKSMQLTTLAEGVETEDQYELLKAWGCDVIQGYYISKPTAPSDIELLCKGSN